MSAADYIVWPCGTWCWGDELDEFTHKSDDYQRLAFESPEWVQFNKENQS